MPDTTDITEVSNDDKYRTYHRNYMRKKYQENPDLFRTRNRLRLMKKKHPDIVISDEQAEQFGDNIYLVYKIKALANELTKDNPELLQQLSNVLMMKQE